MDWKKVKSLEDLYSEKNGGHSSDCSLFKIFAEDFKSYYSEKSVKEVWEDFKSKNVIAVLSNNEHQAQKRLLFLLKYMKFT